jgi:glycosyltransferase involved in cell wall biosynthesis
MRILMVTPHLPPHQAANALLPHQLGVGLRARGHEVEFLTFGRGADAAGVTHIRRRSRRLRGTRLPQALEAAETWIKATPIVKRSDVVHIHSNTWMNQVAARLAVRQNRPYVVTHYGTEIWHHDGTDAAFKRLNAHAAHVALYSHALLARARELAVPMREACVVYPPVADAFSPREDLERRALRREFAPGNGPLLLNVKRLHPLADQATLLEAFARVRRERPEVLLLIAGSGEQERALKAQAARLGLGEGVRFLGLVANDRVASLQAAADLFVLSSVLEATPTVALEALASGTPVVSTDNPGGLELGALFHDDVTVVPRGNPEALARGILAHLAAPRRTRPATAGIIAERFRLPGVVDRYLALYEQARLQGPAER